MRSLILPVLLLAASPVFAADSRTWTDTTGHAKIDAQLVAFDHSTVVLRRDNNELVSLPIAHLSDTDQKYLQSPEAGDVADQHLDSAQTWTLRDGRQFQGQVVDYCRRDVVIQRRRGHMYVNDRRFDNLPNVYQEMLPKVIEHFDQTDIPNRRALDQWLLQLRGQPRTFTLEGVVMEIPSGDEYSVPFFFFSEADLKVLQPGWEHWLSLQENHEEQSAKAFQLQSLAAEYQRDREANQQIAQMQLNLQAVDVGLTSIWEVALYPPPGTPGQPLRAVVPGRNSAQATNAALARNPGYVAGAVRRLSD